MGRCFSSFADTCLKTYVSWQIECADTVGLPKKRGKESISLPLVELKINRRCP